MKRSTAVGHLVEMAEGCPRLMSVVESLSGSQELMSFWAFGSVLDPGHDWTDSDHFASSVMVVDLPARDLPWLAPRTPMDGYLQMAHWQSKPVVVLWRSTEFPVGNHYIERPLQLWSRAAGVHRDAVAALQNGTELESHRAAPPTARELAAQLGAEAGVSLAAVRRTAKHYETRRWQRGDLRPVSDALFEATDGYLDLLDAISSLPPG